MIAFPPPPILTVSERLNDVNRVWMICKVRGEVGENQKNLLCVMGWCWEGFGWEPHSYVFNHYNKNFLHFKDLLPFLTNTISH